MWRLDPEQKTDGLLVLTLICFKTGQLIVSALGTDNSVLCFSSKCVFSCVSSKRSDSRGLVVRPGAGDAGCTT